jgi:hypothetical protein
VNLHRARRIAAVLVASQIRSGRAGSNPRSFFGQPRSLFVYDLLLFAVSFYIAWNVVAQLIARTPSMAQSIPGYVDPILPLLALGVVMVAGVLFELTTTSRFTASDAINWLPVPPREYVLASALAVAYSYSLTVSIALGVGLGVAVPTGTLAPFALTALLSVLGLFEAGVLIEMLRSTTQRASGLLGKRSGRVTIVLRAAVLLAVILSFQLLFNPVLLFSLLGSLGSLIGISAYVPLLWGTRAVAFALAGHWSEGGLFAGGSVLFVAGLLYLAAALRVRFWSVSSAEVRLEAEGYGRQHRWLRAFGLGPVEATVASKDLRGLIRRREMVPTLVLPIVLGVVGVLGVGAGARSSSGFSEILWVGWISGFYALLLSTTSIGQERRGFQNLYALPVRPRQVFRAKAGVGLLLALPFGYVWVTVATVAYHLSVLQVATAATIVLLTVLEGTFLGLVFAARYSDFQERPRPQYLQPSAMLAAMIAGFVVMFSTIIPIELGAGSAGLLRSGVLLGAGLAVGIGTIVVTFGVARQSLDQLFREIPF